jgi:hypothetical protein
MKKINIILFVVFVFAVSCKKDYVCECTITPGNAKSEITIKGVSKGRAKASCVSSSYQEVVGTSTITVNSDCKLK